MQTPFTDTSVLRGSDPLVQLLFPMNVSRTSVSRKEFEKVGDE